VIGDDGVLVVDSSHFPTLARRMIADIRKLTAKPVRFVVNTHWHPDHVFGNAAFREAFPGVAIIAHEETRRLVLKDDPQYIDAQRATARMAAQLRQTQQTGKTKAGGAIGPDDVRVLHDTVPALEGTVGDSEVDLLAPWLTFRDEMTVHLGRREVRILHLGRGNTAGDAVVYVPDAKVLATGDIVVKPTPYAYGSYLSEWATSLRKLEGFDAKMIVPGHGPLDRDFGYVRTLERLLESVTSQTRALAEKDLTLEEVKKRVDVDAFRKQIAGEDPDRMLAFRDGFVTPGVERAYQEAKGKWEDE
jgi:cyclase